MDPSLVSLLTLRHLRPFSSPRSSCSMLPRTGGGGAPLAFGPVLLLTFLTKGCCCCCCCFRSSKRISRSTSILTRGWNSCLQEYLPLQTSSLLSPSLMSIWISSCLRPPAVSTNPLTSILESEAGPTIGMGSMENESICEMPPDRTIFVSLGTLISRKESISASKFSCTSCFFFSSSHSTERVLMRRPLMRYSVHRIFSGGTSFSERPGSFLCAISNNVLRSGISGFSCDILCRSSNFTPLAIQNCPSSRVLSHLPRYGAAMKAARASWMTTGGLGPFIRASMLLNSGSIRW
mmetsp:Transcript_7503/g.10310  ORF Transcript_7503/g.10310 Transcript_7503/m.10310 type:complete len:292 (-) Transcript_7503:619-1494(-)